MATKRTSGALAVAILASLAGCAARAADAGGPPGSVHGQIIGNGGPAPGGPHVLPGTVAVLRAGKVVARQQVPEGGEFRFSLAPGSYRLTVPDEPKICAGTDVVVRSGSDQTANLTCVLK